jgi:rhamnogalacturonan II specific xylosyltransferase
VAAATAGSGTVLLAAVFGPYLPFLSNWLISVRRVGRADQVLVIAEDYETLERINAAWPGHAVLVPPAPDAQAAHKFGSQVSTVTADPPECLMKCRFTLL